MRKKEIAWSHTALNDFLGCPHRYRLVRIQKIVKVTETEDMRFGKVVHKHLEDRVLKKTPLPDYLSWLENMIQRMEQNGEIFAETKVCVDKGFAPTSWFADNAWLRVIYDVGYRNGSEAVILDYKTGKRKHDIDQLKLFAGVEFATNSEVERVKTGYVWTKDKRLDSEIFTREDVPSIWNHFLPRVEKLNEAYAKGLWPAKPSGLCPWCPATLAHCKHAKK